MIHKQAGPIEETGECKRNILRYNCLHDYHGYPTTSPGPYEFQPPQKIIATGHGRRRHHRPLVVAGPNPLQRMHYVKLVKVYVSAQKGVLI